MRRYLVIIGFTFLTPVLLFLLFSLIPVAQNVQDTLGGIAFFGGIIIGLIIGFIVAERKYPLPKKLVEKQNIEERNIPQEISAIKEYAPDSEEKQKALIAFFLSPVYIFIPHDRLSFEGHYLKQGLILGIMIPFISLPFIVYSFSTGSEFVSFKFVLVWLIVMGLYIVYCVFCILKVIKGINHGKKILLPVLGKLFEKLNIRVY